MNDHHLALLIGGVAAAILFGCSGVLQKAANASGGLSLGPYLVLVGLTVAAVGIVALLVQGGGTWAWRPAGWTVGFAVLWALGTAAVAIAIGVYGGRISQLVPLYNANTLVAVVLGLFVWGEAGQVDLRLLLPGSALIVLGGILAARA